ncbi:MAG: glycoside hydrolase family 31 protein [Anaerolineae bacterium]|jgi:alpha-D-xyloside xylohydrolase
MHVDSAGAVATIVSDPYVLQVQTSPFVCRLSGATGGEPVWQMTAVRFRPAGGTWQHVTRAEIDVDEAHHLALQLTAEDGTPLALDITLAQDQLRIDLRTNVDNGGGLTVDLHAQPDEHYLGFGERFDALDQRGKQVDLWVEDGAQGGLTYIPVPFFLSSAGYGLHIDTEVRCVARMATPDDPGVVSIRNAAPELHLTVLPGRTPKKILSRYTALAGRPAVPPVWVFGPWKSRDWQTADQAGIAEDVEQQHELGLPATVKLIDARWEVAYHTFDFDPNKFPDAQRMIDHIHAHGSRLVLWISPWMAVDNGDDPNDAYYACAERGYLIRNPGGEVYVHRLGNNPMLVGSCIDLTNPAAVAWWQDNIRRLVEMGVSGFNTDFGEQVPEDAIFYDGRTGREMHNVYPRLYNELTYEAMQSAPSPTRHPGVLLARSGWHGSQRLSAIWAGDQTSDFAYNSGLRTAIVAGLSAGLSGFPYWTSDIGGYFGTPTDETYMRWTQFGAFCPIMMIHGAGRREPWTFSDQTLDVYRRYARLHTALFPYIYTYAHQASQTGIPIMRAMPLEFPEDPRSWGALAEHQYCLGAELLVAPVYYGFSRIRLLYLPAGLWRDFWTGAPVEGGQAIRSPAEITQIPAFARAGAIIPRLDPTPDTLLLATKAGIQSAGDDLRIDVYAGADGRFQLYDGTEFVWDEAAQELTVTSSPVPRQVSVRRVVEETNPFVTAHSGGQDLTMAAGSLNGEPEYGRVTLSGLPVVFSWRA